MKPLIVAFLFVGSSLCEMVQSSMKPTGSNVAPQKQQTFAEARDGSFTATEWETVPYSAPFQSSFGSQGQVQPSAFGLGGNFNLGFPSWMETGLSVIFTLVGLSILIQLLGKIREIPFVQSLFSKDGRSLDPDQINEMLNFAIDAYDKMQALYEN